MLFRSTQLYVNTSKNFHIVPTPSGIVRKMGDNNHINLDQYGLGNKYLKSLGSSVSHFKGLNKISLGGGRLSTDGIDGLIPSLHQKVTILDFSSNKICKKGYSNIADLLSNQTKT